MATAPKSPKIDDVKRPEKITPPATARPIIVTNHPTMANDPMMAPTAVEEKPADPLGETLNHTGKIIAPLDSSPKDAAEQPAAELVQTPPEAEQTQAEAKAEEKAAEPKPSAPTHEEASDLPAEDTHSKRDPDAAQTAEEAAAAEAQAKRDAELGALIDSGKYAVPINAVQRHRSQVNTLVLCVLALVLLLALVDAVADIGLVAVPSSAPHTHFFSKS
jgi:hypothetical protein